MRDQPRCSRALALEASPAFADGVCIVTGASAGIGAALCEALACELKVSVVAVARRADRLEALRKKVGERIICVVGDVCDPATITKALDACTVPPFALINNAGVAKDGAVILGGNEAAIHETFSINTVAPAAWSTAYFARLEKTKAPRGHVLHISSLSAHRMPDATDLGIYAASKAAGRALWKRATSSTRRCISSRRRHTSKLPTYY